MPGAVDGEERVCAVCSIPLNYQADAEQPWHHPSRLGPGGEAEWDHPAVPVEPNELASVDWQCDFCAGHNARWALPASNFRTPVGSTSVGDWCVCDGCKPAVEAHDWERVILRLRTIYAIKTGTPPRPDHDDFMRALYAGLNEHITGPLYINPPTSRK